MLVTSRPLRVSPPASGCSVSPPSSFPALSNCPVIYPCASCGAVSKHVGGHKTLPGVVTRYFSCPPIPTSQILPSPTPESVG